MSATIHPSSVLLRCPKCYAIMNWFGDEAWCENVNCEANDKRFAVELPKIEVKLTPKES